MSQLSSIPSSNPMANPATRSTSTGAIGILGMGAIGTLMAWHWRHRIEQKQLFALQSSSLRQTAGQHAVMTRQFQPLDGPITMLEVPLWPSIAADNSQPPELDWLVVTTKATHTVDALEPWSDALSYIKRILLLQNGMGQQQEVEQWLESRQQGNTEIWLGISTEGAFRPQPDKVVYAGAGTTVIGPACNTTLPHILPDAMQPVTDIHQRQREKLAINAVINPLTGLLKCRNGELVSNPEYRIQLIQLAQEVKQFYESMGWPLSAPLTERAQQVAEATAQNRSSTLQDLLAGRPTELAYICGYLLSLAASRDYPMPITERLYLTLNSV